jgi:hypothetical protein
MFRAQAGRQWKGTYDLQFKHHESIKSLRNAFDGNCGICRVLYEDLKAEAEIMGKDLTDGQDLKSTAYISVLEEDAFRADFKLSHVGIRAQHTFILKVSSMVYLLRSCIC